MSTPPNGPPPPEPDQREDEREQPERAPATALGLLTAIGSPLALATGLLYYFGWVRSEAQARAFGADASVFAMSTQDYVLRSVNVLFFPVILLLLLGLLALRLDRLLRTREVPPPWLAPLTRGLRFSWVAFLLLAFALLALSGELGRVTLPLWVALSILGPVYGIVLRRLLTGDRRRFSRPTVGIVVTLLTVLLFWQTERLARLDGEALAQEIKRTLDDGRGDDDVLSPIELFSTKDMNLDMPGVTEQRIGQQDAAYGYHYSGLYLLQRSGEKYFLVTPGWDRDEGRLVVLPDTASIRVEFGRRK